MICIDCLEMSAIFLPALDIKRKVSLTSRYCYKRLSNGFLSYLFICSIKCDEKHTKGVLYFAHKKPVFTMAPKMVREINNSSYSCYPIKVNCLSIYWCYLDHSIHLSDLNYKSNLCIHNRPKLQRGVQHGRQIPNLYSFHPTIVNLENMFLWILEHIWKV